MIGEKQEPNTVINESLGWRKSSPELPEILEAKFGGSKSFLSYLTSHLNTTAINTEQGHETEAGTRRGGGRFSRRLY